MILYHLTFIGSNLGYTMNQNYIVKFVIAVIGICLLTSIQAQTPSNATEANNIVNITILHINDIYEIMPVNNGTQGGVARLTTLKEQLVANNPHTYTILSGDLFSPSALSTANIDGERLAGKQMVDLMNMAGLDYATFGNHEFDLKEQQFYDRLTESKFTWFSGNVFDKNSKPFTNVPEYEILEIKTENNQVVKIGMIGMIGVTLNSNLTDYVIYTDPFVTAKEQVKLLKDKVDILIAVTHLSLENYIKLATAEPDLDIILGGHEHENVQVWRGKDFTPVFKADANARSAYIHNLYYNIVIAHPPPKLDSPYKAMQVCYHSILYRHNQLIKYMIIYVRKN